MIFAIFTDLCLAARRSFITAAEILGLIRVGLGLYADDKFGVIVTSTGTSDAYYNCLYEADHADFLTAGGLHERREQALIDLAVVGNCYVVEIGPGFWPYE